MIWGLSGGDSANSNCLHISARPTKKVKASTFYNVTTNIAVPRPTKKVKASTFYNVTTTIAVPRPTKKLRLARFTVLLQLMLPLAAPLSHFLKL